VHVYGRTEPKRRKGIGEPKPPPIYDFSFEPFSVICHEPSVPRRSALDRWIIRSSPVYRVQPKAISAIRPLCPFGAVRLPDNMPLSHVIANLTDFSLEPFR